jgi:crotonobetainyl-CoA:carnitine CoA-transferase CaiB-like acyl-CoA transferase
MSFSPLRGIRVIDFCSNIAGPFASMILAQLGADVVKVEQPGGDDSRYFASQVNGASVVHRYVGAGKRGIALDLKNPDGRRIALDLVGGADVVIQSMRPGVADRLGIGRAAAVAENPSVLYYDVNAFGTGSSGRDLPGYDPLVQAFSGIMTMNGHDGSPPTRCAPSVIDLGTGQWVAMGVLAALLGRGRGEPVATMETALVDTAFSLAAYQATSALVTGQRPPRAGSGNPIAAPYQCYAASDGHLLLAAPSQRLWESAVAALDAPHLLADPRFATVADRSAHRAELEVAIDAVVRHAPVAVWIERLRAAGVPAGTVNGLEEAVVDEVAVERQTFQASDDVPLVRLPWLADGQPLPWTRPAPGLGEHTRELLTELGYPAERIDDLVARSVVVSGSHSADELPLTTTTRQETS